MHIIYWITVSLNIDQCIIANYFNSNETSMKYAAHVMQQINNWIFNVTFSKHLNAHFKVINALMLYLFFPFITVHQTKPCNWL